MRQNLFFRLVARNINNFNSTTPNILYKNENTINSSIFGLALASFVGISLWNSENNVQKCDAIAKTKTNLRNYEDGSQFYIPPADISEMKVFSGNANWYLANEISMHLGVQIGRAKVSRFTDGEINVRVHDNVRGKDVYIVQPLAPPANDSLFELLFLITTLRRASARRITAVIPYFGYGRSTKKSENGISPIAAADVALMLEIAGADRVVAVDLHNSQIQGFFGPNIPVDNLDVSGIAIPYFLTKFLKNPVVVSPDANGAGRAKSFRDKLVKHGHKDASLAVLVNQGISTRDSIKKNNSVNVDDELKNFDLNTIELVGDVKGCDCVIYDDMVDSARSITRCARKLKAAGARRVFAFVTHGLFLGKAYERIEKSELIEVVCVNTLPLRVENTGGVSSWNYCSKVHQLSVAALLAESIRNIHNKESISVLFET